jgi:archaellum component FlaC
MSDLEQDFDQVAAQINAKLKEAADAINEANRLSETINLPSLIYSQWLRDDLYYQNKNSDTPKSKEEVQAELDELQEKLEKIDVRPLESALGQGGWSTSSSYC